MTTFYLFQLVFGSLLKVLFVHYRIKRLFKFIASLFGLFQLLLQRLDFPHDHRKLAMLKFIIRLSRAAAFQESTMKFILKSDHLFFELETKLSN